MAFLNPGSHLCNKHNTSDTSINTREKKHVPFSLCLCLCFCRLCYAYRTSVNQALVSRMGDRETPLPLPRVCTYGCSFADVITNFSRLDRLPIFLTHGASLARFARWSPATIPTFFWVNILCLNTKLTRCCLNLLSYRIWGHNFLHPSVFRGISSNGRAPD